MSEYMAVDSDITKIVVYYDNGTEYVIAKGFVANIEEIEEDGEPAVKMETHMVGMGGRDLYLLVEAVLAFANKIGLFDRMKEAKEDEITETDIR